LVSDAVRLMLTRIAHDHALPFDPLIPNEAAIAAMKDARAGKLESMTLDQLQAEPDADDEAGRQFKRDLKRQAKGQHRAALAREFVAIIETLAKDMPLAEKFRDHALTGEWKDHRDCHIKPDLVLIDRKPDAETLELVRLGSHSEWGL